jgi:hypothetical protein
MTSIKPGTRGKVGKSIDYQLEKIRVLQEQIDAIPLVAELKEEIAKHHIKIHRLRENCPHDNPTKEYDGDGGSYYDQARYWVNFTCLDCGKRWTEDQ